MSVSSGAPSLAECPSDVITRLLVMLDVLGLARLELVSLQLRAEAQMEAMRRSSGGRGFPPTRWQWARECQRATQSKLGRLAASNHTLCSTGSGQLIGFGSNCAGQLGLGHFRHEWLPVPAMAEVPGMESRITGVAAGFLHSAVWDAAGRVWVAGDNEFGQIGPIDREVAFGIPFRRRRRRGPPSAVPVQIQFPRMVQGSVVQVSCGLSFTVILTDRGSLFSFGANDVGQLGIGSHEDDESPNIAVEVKRVAGLDDAFITQVAAGSAHAIALTDDGRAFSWGDRSDGRLGLTESAQLRISEKTGIVDLDRVACLTPTQIHVMHARKWRVQRVACGFAHSMLIANDGELWAFGWNDDFQLGVTSERCFKQLPSHAELPNGARAAEVSCGRSHTVILDTNGRVWMVGDNTSGQCGIPWMVSIRTFVAVDVCAIAQVAAGHAHTVLMDTRGRLWTCGWTDCGRLGQGLVAEDHPTKCVSPCSVGLLVDEG
mmetsp:Transcript_13397/g.33557  ORF Transcript_13397/g.33557 Transcript_13397/m.33557 type:complete len:487 (+) Transcript_13397:14-1474(+)